MKTIYLIDEEGNCRTLEEVRRVVIAIALDRYGANTTEAARRLGVSRSTLYRNPIAPSA